MNVNGTKFHLVRQRDDWGRWISVKQNLPLAELFQGDVDAEIEWNGREDNLRLRRLPVQFRSAVTQPPLSIENRRGAGRDRYLHWYWINETRTGIYFLAQGETHPVLFWSTPIADPCEPAGVGKRGFRTLEPEQAAPMTLSGLTVTAGHYLVVGVVGQGLLVFDLHRGGPPTLLVWSLPAGQSFSPWDLAATVEGGLLILDRDHRRYWQLNRHFQLTTTLPADETLPPETTFQPKDPPAEAEPRRVKRTIPHIGYPLVGNDAHAAPTNPISIDRGPQGTVLVLDAPEAGPSAIYAYEHDTLQTVYPLTYAVSDEDDSTDIRDLQAHDFTYLPHLVGGQDSMPLAMPEAADGETVHLVFVARRDGNQVIAYALNPAESSSQVLPDYLPLRRWREKAIVAAGHQVFYDFEERWIPLGIFLDCQYATTAIIESPTDFERKYRPDAPANRFSLVNGIPEQPFDSNINGCIWHRLLLDAEIPPGTQITIQARASDDPDTLTVMPWLGQPKPYQRSDGAELPYYDPYAARRDDVTLTARAGTWEILFQGIQGRYVQIRLALLGTGRATPEIKSLRVWYPRFSYGASYLPAIYNEEAISASFTERLLANFEGFYTTIEDKMARLSSLLDPRSTPPEALEWLAKWMGVVLHPLWDESRRRFFIRFAHKLYTIRGTVPGIIIALRIFLDDRLDASLFDPACLGQSRIRIIEHFLTRDNAGNIFGDPGSGTATGVSVAAAAHRFSVLLPHRLENEAAVTGETLRMAERIIELEKPAHTWFEIKEYWDMFRVGEARLGLDTEIGYTTYFQPLVLGDSILPNTTLGCPYPYNVQNRFVMERNQVQ